MKQVSDEKLLRMYHDGEKSAFGQLVHRYEKELYNFLLRFLGKNSLAEEAFQETFLQVHIASESFDFSRKFRPWLYTIAANKARDLLRHHGRRPAVHITALDDDTGSSELWDVLMRDDTTAPEILEQREDQELVRHCVSELPEHLREILILAYFEQLSYKEMSQSLDIPLGTVKSRLHAAVAAFAKMYKDSSEKSE
ncbi:MAG: sigma-70 family RNA polymerase sigma factor [Sedimentisphaerales bacterium]|nr:sigma-70 family RNA polymerase sigma factor [Sedimentisphaerales bacterium]